MEIKDILAGKKSVLQFLKEKGFEEEKGYTDDNYLDGTYFKIDDRRLLVVYEISDQERLKEVKDHFLINRGLSYCVIVLPKKLMFFRNFGETKYFIYSERTSDYRTKIEKLKNIKQLDELFQSKDISAQFYELFKLKRNLLVQNIKNKIDPIQKYLIAQKIFDRFFFIYFLCHKGVLRFEDGRPVSGENLFSRILLEKDNFMNNLKKLFHLFNSQEKKILEIGTYRVIIPYLNGGLFRPDVLEQDLDVTLKDDQWKEIFDFLNSYHWIIEDVKASEEGKEEVLTPEILGHVYERSVVEWELDGFEDEAENVVKKVTERKKKGVYYTPESITDYISTQTIIPSLLDKLGNRYPTFEDLINSGDASGLRDALRALDEIKILDPACGSGAFLIKASEALFNLKRRINYKLDTHIDPYSLKLDIITENIYGVDILSGAIEISKLRLWLWLISDWDESKDKIKALPNIEYNLKVGNSLIGWLDEKLTQIPLNIPLTEKVDGIFIGLEPAFPENGDAEDLKKARRLLGGYNLEDYIEAYYILYKIYRRTHGGKAEKLRDILERIKESIYKVVTPSFFEYVNKKIIGIEPGLSEKRQSSKIKKLRGKPPVSRSDFEKLNIFHWRIDFGHIIRNGGFDIVIGNPPYVEHKKLKRFSRIFKAIFRTYSGTADLYVYFYERGVKLLDKGSYLSFISSNKFMRTNYGENLRGFLSELKIMSLIDFTGMKVFDALVASCVLILKKLLQDQQFVPITKMKNDFTSNDYLLAYISKNSYPLTVELLKKGVWSLLDKETYALKLKIEKVGTKIKNINSISVNRGITSGYNSAFIIDEQTKGRLIKSDKNAHRIIKPVLQGRDIKKWFFTSDNTYIINTNFDLDIPKEYPTISEHLNKFKSSLVERSDQGKNWWNLRACKYYDDFEKEKIIWGLTADRWAFAYDVGGHYLPSNAYMLISDKIPIKLILAQLNSNLLKFYFSTFGIMTAGNAYTLKYDTVVDLPVQYNTQLDSELIKAVDEIILITREPDYLTDKNKQERVKLLEKKIDKLVYGLYDLTDEEIGFVETFCSNKGK